MLRARVAERDARIRELEEQLGAKADAERLAAELAPRDAELATLRKRVAELETQLAGVDPGRIAALEVELSRARQQAQRFEQELSESLAWAPDPEDDLKRLQGVGPMFERALKGLGVRTFAQIAAWTDGDVESIAPRIKTTPARIRRDDWIGGARKLCGHA